MISAGTTGAGFLQGLFGFFGPEPSTRMVTSNLIENYKEASSHLGIYSYLIMDKKERKNYIEYQKNKREEFVSKAEESMEYMDRLQKLIDNKSYDIYQRARFEYYLSKEKVLFQGIIDDIQFCTDIIKINENYSDSLKKAEDIVFKCTN